MDLFVRKLVYVDLCKRNANKILRQIQRLHWEEKDVVAILHKVFSRPGKVKYGNIHLLAGLLSALYRHHSSFVIGIVDELIESIIFGLELNDFRMNQKRLAQVKYLGEFFTYRLVEHPVVFDILYKILTLGHGGAPVPGRINPVDLPDEYFRIRLVATVLETTGSYFNKGASGKKLDFFLAFFQFYIFTKDPLPMDIEFIVQDTFALLRPQWKLAVDLEEAARVFQAAVTQDQEEKAAAAAKNGKGAASAATGGEADEEQHGGPASDDGSSDDEIDHENDLARDDVEANINDDEELLFNGDREGDGDADEDEDDDDDDDEHGSRDSDDSGSESEDEEIVVTREEEQIDPEDEAEFEREYARMMAESLQETKKFERKPMFDLALPVRPKAAQPGHVYGNANTDDNKNSDSDDDGDDRSNNRSNGRNSTPTMAFSLLTKRGNRQQTRTLELPSDSDFAVAMRNQQQADREEQQRIKNLVLNLDLQQSDEGEAPERATSYYHNRPGGGGKNHSQRVRKLQLSDVDWT